MIIIDCIDCCRSPSLSLSLTPTHLPLFPFPEDLPPPQPPHPVVSGQNGRINPRGCFFSSLVTVPDMNSSPAAADRHLCAAHLNAACGFSLFQKKLPRPHETIQRMWGKWVTWPFQPPHRWSHLCKAMQAIILAKAHLWADAYYSRWCHFWWFSAWK